MGETFRFPVSFKEEFEKNLRRNFGIPTNPRERRATRRYLKKYGWRIAGGWLLILLASPFFVAVWRALGVAV